MGHTHTHTHTHTHSTARGIRSVRCLWFSIFIRVLLPSAFSTRSRAGSRYVVVVCSTSLTHYSHSLTTHSTRAWWVRLLCVTTTRNRFCGDRSSVCCCARLAFRSRKCDNTIDFVKLNNSQFIVCACEQKSSVVCSVSAFVIPSCQ